MADKVGDVYRDQNFSIEHDKERKRNKGTKSKKKKRKSRKPVVEINSRKDRKIISEYHCLNKKIDALRKNPSIDKEDTAAKIAVLEAKKEQLGGINAYQQASKLGETRHGSFNSGKWVVKQLKAFNVQPIAQKPFKLRVLDVGALDNNYQKHAKWIQCTPIDLNPQNGNVLKADLLTLHDTEIYDVVVLSLVVNFEGDIRKRGNMLRKCQELLVDKGHLFFVLPLPCLKNSRYLSEALFVSMMDSLGFDVCKQHNSKKLSFYMFRKTRHPQAKPFPKQVLRQGGNLNNFAIVL